MLFNLLVVDSSKAYKRWLTFHGYRNYPESKLQENIDSEIMEVLLQEAHEAFDPEIVIELTSNTSDEMDTNVDRIIGWIDQWKKDNSDE